MSWISIFAWLLVNYGPQILELLKKLLNQKTMTVAKRESLRVQLSDVIRSPADRGAKRTLVKQIIASH